MSKLQTPPIYNEKALQTQWLNVIFQSHELICGCNKAPEHFQDLINSQKCRHFKDAATGTETFGTTDDQDLTIDAGDLENLFSAENDVDEG